ncbi:MAG: nucleotidyltransferase domain-containing protein [Saprospiraceae bacterium]|nr:nucleotidyltransferase domain-containing protein [Saprospiraceae bacterium]
MKKGYWKERFGNRQLILFGSMALDQAKPESDIDLIYKKDPIGKMSYQEYIDFIRDLENALQNRVDLVVKDKMNPIVAYDARIK